MGLSLFAWPGTAQALIEWLMAEVVQEAVSNALNRSIVGLITAT